MSIDLDLDVMLAPLGEDEPCGANLEYDADFLALEEAVRVDPGQEFGSADGGDAIKIEGASIDWVSVRKIAEGLFLRTRDLRVAVYLTRALLRTEGFAGVTIGLRLIAGLLERHWDHLYPQLDADDDNDPTMRVNALAPLVAREAVIDDLRDGWLLRSRQSGVLSVHSLELAQGRVSPLESETVLSEAQVAGMLAEAVEQNPDLPVAAQDAVTMLKQISNLLMDRVGSSNTLDFKPLEAILVNCRTALAQHGIAEASLPENANGVDPGSVPVLTESSRPGEIRSRKDVIAALDQVVQYLQRTEPTNPAQMLLRRAQRVMNMSFLEAINELAPEALHQAELMLGEQLNSPEG